MCDFYLNLIFKTGRLDRPWLHWKDGICNYFLNVREENDGDRDWKEKVENKEE